MSQADTFCFSLTRESLEHVSLGYIIGCQSRIKNLPREERSYNELKERSAG
jgi:hypothetical protein